MPKKATKILVTGSEKLLARVPEEYVFWCHDGRALRDMPELGEALTTMSDETFAYHSNAEKQDFSNWVKDIIGDEKLAGDLAKASSRSEAAKKVAARIATIRKRSA
ncbi:MAG: hypothetical protein HW402_123 [Dehalococcoidales bacterium]|nr:hypothetical protein [Dehalococcoidales bacterium]